MIKINNSIYNYSKFPNGEIKFPDFTVTLKGNKNICINWIFENNEEFFILQILIKYLKEIKLPIILEVPFCPYGQQDRKIEGQLFSFKYFAQLINDMNLDKVIFYDPHSLVMDASIKNSEIHYLIHFSNDHSIDIISTEAKKTYDKYDISFYPDNGAAKKYSEVYKEPYRYGNKKRNLDTGEIISYEIIADRKDIKGKNVLIVDDLCMRGGTFKEAAQKLKEFGAKSIGLQITHFMPNSLQFLKEFKNFGIDKIYTHSNGISKLVLDQLTEEEKKDIFGI